MISWARGSATCAACLLGNTTSTAASRAATARPQVRVKLTVAANIFIRTVCASDGWGWDSETDAHVAMLESPTADIGACGEPKRSGSSSRPERFHHS